ncbi:Penicillin-binding protein A [Streptomyces sp. RB5]|uniref:Penicillin-binding protein A n=1 Tax=Streptomyces smaragdinus TaxID=2585196 RepID=A0A7K0CIX8_9ACTN|nr:penicillin-binding transpeptidase domain-containing protein [Streptomyces smaragdinus]MQY12704.1 Penicillin-binding protein A [Streptomyces smaragdinus]
MNKPLRRVAIFAGLLVLALLARVNWLQFVQGEELSTHKDNRRVAIGRYAIPRGDIIVGDKSVTGHAETTGSDFKFKRTWKDGPLWAPVTGYASQAFGANQLEEINDGILTGTDDRLFFDRTIDMITGEERQGGDVVTTINADAQRAAYNGLKGKKGAAVAIDPKTGAILALVSTPSYDPSSFAGNSDKDSEAWTKLNSDKNKPMLNRALRETYPPGSTFKVVTAAAALENGTYDIDQNTHSDPVHYKLPLTTDSWLPNPIAGKCGNASMEVGLQWSCNTVFAKVSDEVGNKAMIEQAEKFGFNEEQFVPIRSAESVYPEMDRPQNALGGIGQSSVRATPLQMAMVAAAVANDGKLMKPYLVDKLLAPNLDTIERTEPQELREAVSEETARKLQQGMETVVRDGTGAPVQLTNATVGGKTGTAQHGDKNEALPYAWMITYAKGENGKDVAVAVVVEDGSADREQISGSGIAGPIAKSVMQAIVGKGA